MAFSKYFIIICPIGILSSCNNKEEEYLLQESTKRLQQQNEYVYRDNKMLRHQFYDLTHEDFPVAHIGYLEKDAENFYQTADHLWGNIEAAIISGTRSDTKSLYQNYTAFQIYYRQLKKRIRDSFSFIGVDTSINTFMNLNESEFTLKYRTDSDSGNRHAGLLLLASDALLNEHIFMEKMVNILTPAHYFERIRAIAMSDKHTYKKGEKLEVKTIIPRQISPSGGYAVMNGQKIAAQDGVFYYSRTITEAPGHYEIPIKVCIETNGRQNIYPAKFAYVVE